MSSLIIGGNGFAGGYLAEYLLKLNEDVIVTKLPSHSPANSNLTYADLDILNYQNTENVIAKYSPDYIYNLAAQSSVKLSWEKPCLTSDININGTINIFEAVKNLKCKCRILNVGSSEEYGIISPDMLPVNENTPLNPANIYAVTKVCQEMLADIYIKSYGLDIISVRPFNHIGAGQSSDFVVSDFCRQTAEIELALRPPVIHTGNLSAKRDFTDVRDIARAYHALMLNGSTGSIYNIGSGKSYSIAQILNMIIGMSDTHIDIICDAEKMRPIDVPEIYADISAISSQTGWKPLIPIEKSLEDILNFWRSSLKKC